MLHEYQQKVVPNEYHSLNEIINNNTAIEINPTILNYILITQLYLFKFYA